MPFKMFIGKNYLSTFIFKQYFFKRTLNGICGRLIEWSRSNKIQSQSNWLMYLLLLLLSKFPLFPHKKRHKYCRKLKYNFTWLHFVHFFLQVRICFYFLNSTITQDAGK